MPITGEKNELPPLPDFAAAPMFPDSRHDEFMKMMNPCSSKSYQSTSEVDIPQQSRYSSGNDDRNNDRVDYREHSCRNMNEYQNHPFSPPPHEYSTPTKSRPTPLHTCHGCTPSSRHDYRSESPYRREYNNTPIQSPHKHFDESNNYGSCRNHQSFHSNNSSQSHNQPNTFRHIINEYDGNHRYQSSQYSNNRNEQYYKDDSFCAPIPSSMRNSCRHSNDIDTDKPNNSRSSLMSQGRYSEHDRSYNPQHQQQHNSYDQRGNDRYDNNSRMIRTNSFCHTRDYDENISCTPRRMKNVHFSHDIPSSSKGPLHEMDMKRDTHPSWRDETPNRHTGYNKNERNYDDFHPVQSPGQHSNLYRDREAYNDRKSPYQDRIRYDDERQSSSYQHRDRFDERQSTFQDNDLYVERRPMYPDMNRNQEYEIRKADNSLDKSFRDLSIKETSDGSFKEKNHSEARFQLLREIRMVMNMRKGADNDNDKKFWDLQLESLNRALMKLLPDGSEDILLEAELKEFLSNARKKWEPTCDLSSCQSTLSDSNRPNQTLNFVPGNVVVRTPLNKDTISTGPRFRIVKVRAPMAMKEGYEFTANIDGEPVKASVPSGGVLEGEIFPITIPNKSSKSVDIIAPYDLPEGFQFHVTIGGKNLIAHIPKGGVLKDVLFTVIYTPDSFTKHDEIHS